MVSSTSPKDNTSIKIENKQQHLYQTRNISMSFGRLHCRCAFTDGAKRLEEALTKLEEKHSMTAVKESLRELKLLHVEHVEKFAISNARSQLELSKLQVKIRFSKPLFFLICLQFLFCVFLILLLQKGCLRTHYSTTTQDKWLQCSGQEENQRSCNSQQST